MTFGIGPYAVAPFAVSRAAAGGGAGPHTVDVAGAGAMVYAASGAVDVALGAPPSGTITITSPLAHTMRQRTLPAGVATFTVAGAYTGTPGAIEVRWAGSAWSTLVAAPTGGTYSQTLVLPTGQGTLEVRHASDTAVTASSAFITVGDIFATPGQSNNVGAATSVVAPVASAFTALEYLGGAWVPLREGLTVGDSYSGLSGYGGSYVGALTNRLQAQGVPVGFVPCAQGSTAIASWQKGGGLYSTMVSRINAVGGVRANLFWQGETDANNSPVQATYAAALNQHINDVFADLGIKTFVVKIVRWIAGADVVRAAQSDVIASNPNVAGSADADVYAPSGVHYLTTTDINAVADRIHTGMVAAFYTPPVVLGAGSDQSRTVDAGGGLGVVYTLSAGSDQVLAVDAGGPISGNIALGAGQDQVSVVDAGGGIGVVHTLGAGADQIVVSDPGGMIGGATVPPQNMRFLSVADPTAYLSIA